jgi:predicted nucleic acid-binding protein
VANEGEVFRARSFDELTRSDQLPAMVSLLGPMLQQLGAFGVTLRVRLVLDTSTVISELVWLVSRRKSADARTSLAEAIAAQVVIACAPPQIDDEVRGNLDSLAKQTRKPQAEIWQAWLEYKRLVTILEPDPVVTSATSYLSNRDRSDVAFLQVSETIAASAVLSHDRDLLDADKRAIRPHDISIDLRNYARAKTIELTIFGLTTFSLNIGSSVLIAALRTLPAIGRALRALPSWVYVTVIGVLLWVLSKKERREAIGEAWGRVRGWLGTAADSLKGPVMDLFRKAIAAHEEALQAQERIESKSKVRRLLLRQAVHIALAQADGAVSLVELEAEVRRIGYVSNAKSLVGPLVRALRGDARFVERNAGWALANKLAVSDGDTRTMQ